jgi:putative NADH-flavin reductase
MNIFLFGATGRTGYEILKRIAQETHTVKILARNPAKLNLSEIKLSQKEQVELIEGDVFEPDKLIEHFKDCDVIISALGTGKGNSYTEIYSQGGRNILSAMRSNKIYYDQTRWETILDDTKDIDWICVRPTYLTNKSLTGKYRVKLNHCPKGGWKISRADLADFIVKQINSDEYIHKKPVIAY